MQQNEHVNTATANSTRAASTAAGRCSVPRMALLPGSSAQFGAAINEEPHLAIEKPLDLADDTVIHARS